MVIVGDFNHNFCVHAPAQDRGAEESGPPVIHFSGSPHLPSIPEGSASSSSSTTAPDGQMVGFIKALLNRAKDAAALFALSGEWFSVWDWGRGGGDLGYYVIALISILIL